MAWTPTNRVPQLTLYSANLLAYIAANYAEALTWAGGGSLPSFVRVYNSAAGRIYDAFPYLLLLDESAATDYTSDLNETAWQVTLEWAISADATQAADANSPIGDDLAQQARVYAMALESVLLNIPSASLLSGATYTNAPEAESIQTDFDALRQGPSGYLQIGQTRAIYRIQRVAY